MVSQQTRVTVHLREMILNGAFAPGEHITETGLAKTLGVSRTPVRLALGVLEQEGLVTGAPNRGFRVERYSVQDISDAIDVRGTLEGMAARLVAEEGLARATVAELRQCLDIGDAIVGRDAIGEDDVADFGAMNERFHGAIVEAAGNRTLQNGVALANRRPFVAPVAIAIHESSTAKRQMSLAQTQHHMIVEALENGEGARAEALLREHALVSKKSLNLMDEAVEAGAQPMPPALRLVRAL